MSIQVPLDIRHNIRHIICKYFLSFRVLSFHCIVSFDTQAFNFDDVYFIYFSFEVISKNLLLTLRSLRFIPVFSSKSFTVLALTFKSSSIFSCVLYMV